MSQRLLLHIGLHKTGTTYFQRRVWPCWSGVGYAGKPFPIGSASTMSVITSMRDPVILMSNESNSGSLTQSYLHGYSWSELQLKELQKLKDKYSGKYDIGIIISLRRHDKWILSIYKHYLKYGGVETLDSFLGLNSCKPTIAVDDMLFMNKIRRVEEILGVLPFCFFIEEVERQPDVLSAALAAYAGVSTGPDFSSGVVLNEGVNEAEARVCRIVNRFFVNPGCVGKGGLKRYKTYIFKMTRKAKKLGFIGSNAGDITYSSVAKSFVIKHFSSDLEDALRMVSAQRGAELETLRNKLGINL